MQNELNTETIPETDLKRNFLLKIQPLIYGIGLILLILFIILFFKTISEVAEVEGANKAFELAKGVRYNLKYLVTGIVFCLLGFCIRSIKR